MKNVGLLNNVCINEDFDGLGQIVQLHQVLNKKCGFDDEVAIEQRTTATIEQLQSELKASKAQVAIHSEENLKLKNVTADLIKCEQNFKKKSNENWSNLQKVKKLEVEKKVDKSQVQSLQQNIDKIKNESENSKTEIKELKLTISELKADKAECKAERSELKAEKLQCNKQLESIQNLQDNSRWQKNGGNDKLIAELKEKEAEIDKLKTEINQLNNRVGICWD